MDKRFMFKSDTFDIMDSYYGANGGVPPTKEEEQNKDYLVICTVQTQEDAENICGILNILNKELHLAYFAQICSTVNSFKGDPSKRYRYNAELDIIFDTANTYGQYDKQVGNKEVTILLNNYETSLRELTKENMEYHNIVSCANCAYHNYDWYDGDDEFEVCDKGNEERMIDYGFCEQWSEL